MQPPPRFGTGNMIRRCPSAVTARGTSTSVKAWVETTRKMQIQIQPALVLPPHHRPTADGGRGTPAPPPSLDAGPAARATGRHPGQSAPRRGRGMSPRPPPRWTQTQPTSSCSTQDHRLPGRHQHLRVQEFSRPHRPRPPRPGPGLRRRAVPVQGQGESPASNSTRTSTPAAAPVNASANRPGPDARPRKVKRYRNRWTDFWRIEWQQGRRLLYWPGGINASAQGILPSQTKQQWQSWRTDGV